MNKKLALAPLGMLLVLAAQPATSSNGSVPTKGCIATADIGVLNPLNTIRVTHQAFNPLPVIDDNLCFQVVAPSGGQPLGHFCQTLDLNQSVTYSIAEIYKKANVPLFTPYAPNLVQVVETDGNSMTHDMQATYGSPVAPDRRVPLIFTCPYVQWQE